MKANGRHPFPNETEPALKRLCPSIQTSKFDEQGYLSSEEKGGNSAFSRTLPSLPHFTPINNGNHNSQPNSPTMNGHSNSNSNGNGTHSPHSPLSPYPGPSLGRKSRSSVVALPPLTIQRERSEPISGSLSPLPPELNPRPHSPAVNNTAAVPRTHPARGQSAQLVTSAIPRAASSSGSPHPRTQSPSFPLSLAPIQLPAAESAPGPAGSSPVISFSESAPLLRSLSPANANANANSSFQRSGSPAALSQQRGNSPAHPLTSADSLLRGTSGHQSPTVTPLPPLDTMSGSFSANHRRLSSSKSLQSFQRPSPLRLQAHLRGPQNVTHSTHMSTSVVAREFSSIITSQQQQQHQQQAQPHSPHSPHHPQAPHSPHASSFGPHSPHLPTAPHSPHLSTAPHSPYQFAAPNPQNPTFPQQNPNNRPRDNGGLAPMDDGDESGLQRSQSDPRPHPSVQLEQSDSVNFALPPALILASPAGSSSGSSDGSRSNPHSVSNAVSASFFSDLSEQVTPSSYGAFATPSPSQNIQTSLNYAHSPLPSAPLPLSHIPPMHQSMPPSTVPNDRSSPSRFAFDTAQPVRTSSPGGRNLLPLPQFTNQSGPIIVEQIQTAVGIAYTSHHSPNSTLVCTRGCPPGSCHCAPQQLLTVLPSAGFTTNTQRVGSPSLLRVQQHQHGRQSAGSPALLSHAPGLCNCGDCGARASPGHVAAAPQFFGASDVILNKSHPSPVHVHQRTYSPVQLPPQHPVSRSVFDDKPTEMDHCPTPPPPDTNGGMSSDDWSHLLKNYRKKAEDF